MTTLDKFIGRMALFFVFFGIVWTIIALTEPVINGYKVAFWFVITIGNMGNYLNYKWNSNR